MAGSPLGDLGRQKDRGTKRNRRRKCFGRLPRGPIPDPRLGCHPLPYVGFYRGCGFQPIGADDRERWPEETALRKRPSRLRPEEPALRKRPPGPRSEEPALRKRPPGPRSEEPALRKRPSRLRSRQRATRRSLARRQSLPLETIDRPRRVASPGTGSFLWPRSGQRARRRMPSRPKPRRRAERGKIERPESAGKLE